ncbi:MAG TPA: methylmalonyl-CoA epimerase [Caldithrix abyssi]|uniref:Methylmalonyl-CoA epimerase n=1 Tax=Caldithrix abyssi TaxID=187145 RepID=A0A7V4WUR2_CALAY|nr:methylmalonyl-CoA epimerase [Caldithrix abyssi]
MITKINHIGIAVRSLEEHIPFYRDVLGLRLIGREEVADQKVKTAIFAVGEVRIELLEPMAQDSPIAKFIEKRGEGMHHIAYESDDIEGDLAGFKNKHIQLIDEQPRPGAHNTLIAFLHPNSTGKVLTEICRTKG